MRTVDDLRRALDYPSGPANMDISAIIRRGQRRRAVRLAGGTGFATVVAVVAVAVAVDVVPNVTAPDGIGSDPSTGGTTAVTTTTPPGPPSTEPNPLLVAPPGPPTEAPTQFDPLRRTLRVGWLPAGLVDSSLQIRPELQTYSAFNFHAGGATSGATDVAVLARGRPVSELPLSSVSMPINGAKPVEVETPTDPINGRPAVCLSDPAKPGTCPAIRWQYGPDAWARVVYWGTEANTAAEVTAMARRIAESVSLTAGEPLRLPFGLGGGLATMPGTLSVVSIVTSRPPGAEWSGSLQLGKPGTDSILVTANHAADDAGADKQQDPNTTVDGYPARHERLGDFRRLVVWGADRNQVSVESPDHPDDPLTIYRQLRLPAPGEQPADWLPVR